MGVRQSIYAFILFSLIVFKVSSATIHFTLHHSHAAHDEPCELCEQAFYNQFLEFSSPIEFHVFEEYEKLEFHQQESVYESVIVTTLLDYTLAVRPPPVPC